MYSGPGWLRWTSDDGLLPCLRAWTPNTVCSTSLSNKWWDTGPEAHSLSPCLGLLIETEERTSGSLGVVWYCCHTHPHINLWKWGGISGWYLCFLSTVSSTIGSTGNPQCGVKQPAIQSVSPSMSHVQTHTNSVFPGVTQPDCLIWESWFHLQGPHHPPAPLCVQALFFPYLYFPCGDVNAGS